MTSLRAALERFRPHYDGGGGTPPTSDDAAAIDTLRNDLKSAFRAAANTFYLYVAMLTIIFVGAIGMIASFRDNPSAIGAIFTASGISLPGVLILMNKAWKDKVAAVILIAAIGTMSKKDLKRLVDNLWRQWYEKGNSRPRVRIR